MERREFAAWLLALFCGVVAPAVPFIRRVPLLVKPPDLPKGVWRSQPIVSVLNTEPTVWTFVEGSNGDGYAYASSSDVTIIRAH